MRHAVWKFELPNLSPCKHCGFMIRSHFACSQCGHYGDKLVVEPKKKAKQQKDS